MIRMVSNPNDKRYGNYNCVDPRTNNSAKHSYIKETGIESLGMSQNVMSNSSPNDIEYHNRFSLKDQHDSTSIENTSGKKIIIDY